MLSKVKKTRSFRTRMIELFVMSLLVSGAVTYLLYRLLQSYYNQRVRYADDPIAQARGWIYDIGDLNFFLIFFLPLSFFFFYMFTKPYVTYFKEISNGIHRLANGDFNGQVQVSSDDEFGVIASDLNLAGEMLQKAVERGDFAETSKDQLVLNLAHDLRTPLTSVLGYLDFILRDEQLTPEQVKHFAAIAFNKSQRLERLVDELFELTRMNYGMLTLEKREIDLSELLMQMSEELYPLFKKSRLTARMDLPPHLMMVADGELLARVFENLLTNAARYGQDGEYVDVRGRIENGEAILEVINYGDSIKPEDLPHLFDMFYTGDRARSPEGSTGLGLFIVKNIVEQHEGTITAESSTIRTIFTVRLPI
ncbi:His Kinase A (phospho-acceptor) domain-containing protein [Paenibacillus catalpae]|uniref:histidine kinase n=1 Tax=Paenibacillus catalpae TaxID=1045775 RepID=A0A1I2GTW5_9BACL|nr:HAMP domain-containing sensor histidine kinase [Paenibacillus catalpae]SFF20076.1 His Kinase A (phospho-acceptor) domain-containing protein [Paenibacillus catalpae]